MLDGTHGFDRRQELVDVIHRVRNRWRMKLALRGAVIVVAGTLLALFLSASSLEALRFSPTAINRVPCRGLHYLWRPRCTSASSVR